MLIDAWKAAAVMSLVVATVTLATYCFLKLRTRRDPRARKTLGFELPLTVFVGSVLGCLIGELVTGRHPVADLDEVKTLLIPLLFGMTSRSLIMFFLKDEKGATSAAKYAPGTFSLLIGVLIAGGTTYLGA
ncbi:hypothetical protein OG875_07890 [Streptomyces sp. NBC_01498]|uniref:hypothetical protein n=1 Tax=Streptomyces sp. NBC_01498 TaxID=2975870 RepID=UPI002E7C2247|nr:hypothetical protein [Streptomyces sp. NBC_01498]WTL24527.1 hypothetical protein OG875_07890 [Streptomyces sp. NBC_01498]